MTTDIFSSIALLLELIMVVMLVGLGYFYVVR